MSVINLKALFLGRINLPEVKSALYNFLEYFIFFVFYADYRSNAMPDLMRKVKGCIYLTKCFNSYLKILLEWFVWFTSSASAISEKESSGIKWMRPVGERFPLRLDFFIIFFILLLQPEILSGILFQHHEYYRS